MVAKKRDFNWSTTFPHKLWEITNDSMQNLNIKKTFLYTLIGSIALSALMGIWAILSGEFGEFQAKILGTTLTVVGTSLLGLACGAFLESPQSQEMSLKIIPISGIVLAFVAAITVLLMIWGQFDNIWKLASISGIFAFTLAQLSLLLSGQSFSQVSMGVDSNLFNGFGVGFDKLDFNYCRTQ